MRFAAVAAALLLAARMHAQSPAAVLWPAGEVERVAESWEKAGVAHEGTVSHFDNLDVHWTRSGIFAVGYTSKDAQQEIARLQSLGVAICERTPHYVLFDTAAQGKFNLALLLTPSHTAVPRSDLRIAHLAFATRELEAVSAYWRKLGFPILAASRASFSEVELRGAPADLDIKIAWQPGLSIPIEWIQPLQGPSIYERTDGFHHIALPVDDIALADTFWNSLGQPKIMSGAWGTEGKPASGRFSFHDANAIGGSYIELLWNYR